MFRVIVLVPAGLNLVLLDGFGSSTVVVTRTRSLRKQLREKSRLATPRYEVATKADDMNNFPRVWAHEPALMIYHVRQKVEAGFLRLNLFDCRKCASEYVYDSLRLSVTRRVCVGREICRFQTKTCPLLLS